MAKEIINIKTKGQKVLDLNNISGKGIYRKFIKLIQKKPERRTKNIIGQTEEF
jgi:hypothetical protein